MKYIIDKSQITKALESFKPEDVEFVKKYREIKGVYPKFRGLQQDPSTVGKFYPNHSKANIKLKSFVDTYIKGNLSKIVALLSSQEDVITPQKMGGGKVYKTMDSKHLLRSEFEVLAYNIFLLNKVQDEITVDDNSFLKTCNKIPDFYWKNKNKVIEIAGMEDEKYKDKLFRAEKCYKNLGLEPVIIWTREFEKNSKYKEFYIKFCTEVGLPINQEVVNNPFEYIGYRNIDREYMEKYIKNNVGSYTKSSNTTRILNKFINQLYGISLKDYQKLKNIPRYQKSIDYAEQSKEIVKFKKENPNMSNTEIGKIFNKTKNQIQRIWSQYSTSI